MPLGREQSQRMPPRAGHLLQQTACYRPTKPPPPNPHQNLKGKEKPRQMCMEELSHHVRRDGPSVFLSIFLM